RVYVCGKAEAGGIASPSWRNLIITNKTRDELLAHATKSAKMFLIGGAAAFVVGSALATIGGMTSRDDAKSAATTSATSAKPAATAEQSTAVAKAETTGASMPANHPGKPAPKTTSTP